MQFWGIFYIALWSICVIIYSIIFYFLQAYEQPLRIIIIYLCSATVMLYFLVYLGKYDILDFSQMYIAFLTVVKILEQFRGLISDLSVISSVLRYDKDEDRQKYLILMLHLLNKLFFVNAGRIGLAFIWGFCGYILSVLLHPVISNVFLFGRNVNNKHFHYLKPLRKIRAKQSKFGLKV